VTVAIIDYGSGNLRSAAKALRARRRDSGSPMRSWSPPDPEEAAAAERIVLPGVGAFADCMRRARARCPACPSARKAVLARQALPRHLRRHAADGRARPRIRRAKGLGWIKGDVKCASSRRTPTLKVPHMGWNTLDAVRCRHPYSSRHHLGRRPTPISSIPIISRRRDR
jgi:glutamine amidotransferase